MAEKKWSEMTKDERAAKIAEGKRAAAAARESENSPDVSALVQAEVAKALAAIKSSPVVTGAKDPKDMTKEELKAEHERLQAALEALPFVGDEAGGLRPGTIINKGQINSEYVPHTRDWFLDVEARRQDRNYHNGRPAELTWPNYSLHTVIYTGQKMQEVIIQGVGFALVPGVPCQLPTPHYGLYLESLAGLRKHEEQFAPPTPKTNPGYLHVNFSQSNGKPVAVLLGKGGLPSIEEREALDAKPA